MKKVWIILALALCYPSLLICQVNHSVWYGDFDLRSNSLLLPHIINSAYDIHVPKRRLYDENGEIKAVGTLLTIP